MTLVESLKPFFLRISPEERAPALRSVARFVFLEDYKDYRTRIKKELSSSSYKLFYQEVREFLKASFDCRKISMAVLFSLHEKIAIKKATDTFGAEYAGTKLLWKALHPEDRLEVKKRADSFGGFNFLSMEDFNKIVKKLESYCKKTAYRKLRFLKDNDCALGLDDLGHDLLIQGIQVVRRYEYTGDIGLITNYAKRGISNHAINMIQYYTSESRACVDNVTSGCGTCLMCLTNKPQRCPHAVADYSTKTLSIDSSSSFSLFDSSLPDPNKLEEKVQGESFVSFIKEGVSEEAGRVVDLVLGAADNEFEEWLLEEHDVSVDKLLTNPRRLISLFCAYVEVSSKEVTADIRARFSSYRNQVA